VNTGFTPGFQAGFTSLAVALITVAWASVANAEYTWDLPPGFPVPFVPAGNPMTAAKVKLGERLFFDQRLSSTGHTSCASCHQPDLAFTDGRTTAIGATGERHSRNTPSLYNTAYNASYGWADPTVTTLEQQHSIPMFNQDPVEMGLTPEGLEGLLTNLSADLELRREVISAFPDSAGKLTLTRITRALASFLRTLISGNSAYDRYLYYDDRTHFSKSAGRGMALFFSDRLKCSECHASFNFSGPVRSQTQPAVEPVFHNTGLYNLEMAKGISGGYPDTGLYQITGLSRDMGAFRAPSLRNVGITGPYMHDGSIQTLGEVIDFYAAGGRSITAGNFRGDGRKNPWKREQIGGFELTSEEKSDLVSFLQSLRELPEN